MKILRFLIEQGETNYQEDINVYLCTTGRAKPGLFLKFTKLRGTKLSAAPGKTKQNTWIFNIWCPRRYRRDWNSLLYYQLTNPL